jgi:uncharacterized protein (TIGR00369 family)
MFSPADLRTPLSDFYTHIKPMFENIPFNKTLGLTLVSISEEGVIFRFRLGEGLLGNPVQRVLHGGAICAAIDATGGAAAMVGAYLNLLANNASADEFKRLERIGTVSLHIDFLRPGIGESFTCKGILNRAGSKIISISMELRNEKDVLIAIGGGSFIH